MPAGRTEPAHAPPLPPFPEGWYFVESRQTVLKARLIEKTWMGENIITWCDESGRVCVAEAVYPHLGSDLGPEAGGGRIRDRRLVCPFHGFEFDTTGQCVDTPFAAPPRSARLRVFETQEISGLIFAWWGSGGRAPQWCLPRDPLEQASWHPQDPTPTRVTAARSDSHVAVAVSDEGLGAPAQNLQRLRLRDHVTDARTGGGAGGSAGIVATLRGRLQIDGMP